MNISALRPESRFFQVVTPESEAQANFRYLLDWARENSERLVRGILRSADHGVLLFRGFEVFGANDFAELISALGIRRMKYIAGNNPRNEIADKIYLSTSYPPSWKITLHSEMSHLDVAPKIIALHATRPPTGSGGETGVASTRTLLDEMPKEVVTELKSKGVTYIQRMRDAKKGFGFGRTWQDVFLTDDRGEAEAFCKAHHIGVEWEETSMIAYFNRPATIPHPEFGHEIWFNQAEQWHNSNLDPTARKVLMEKLSGKFPHHARFTSGEEFDLAKLDSIRRVYDQHVVLHSWKKNDVMLVNNYSMAHGRMPFTGERELLFMMADF